MYLTWKELLDSDFQNVTVQSYGYMERGMITQHFEPFSKLKEFEFKIYRFEDGTGSLHHNWLILEDPEDELIFSIVDGRVILRDPDLWARPSY